jgi:hypothetical protein
MSNTENKQYTVDDLRKAFEAGQDSVKTKISYEDCGDRDAYAEKVCTRNFDQWLKSIANTEPSYSTRFYREPRIKRGVMTIPEFEELVEDGMITDEDGQGYWTKGGLASSDDVFDTPQLDADGVVWYNK